MRPTKSRNRPAIESLESRYAPAVSFNSGTGLLSVTGDEAGPADDVILAGLNGSFVEVTINGVLHSSDPGSAGFDAALTGATNASVTSINIQGLAGDDAITVGDGFTAASGQITLEGGLGRDTLTGGAQAELLIGRQGADELHGGGGADTLRGSRGNDRLFGDAGDDLLRGGNGNDTLQGGEGTDTVMQVVDADQTLSDTQLTGRGTDELGGIERGDLTGGAGDNRIDASEFTLGRVGIQGGARNDTLIGGAGNDELYGGLGNDSLIGGGGDDLLINEGGGSDTMIGGLGNDHLIAGGQEAMDSLMGGEGNDTLRSGDACDGALGDSTLVGGAGTDDFTLVLGREFQIVDLTGEDTIIEASRMCPL